MLPLGPKAARVREAFEAADVSDDVACQFLRRFSASVDTLKQVAGWHQAVVADYRAFRRSKTDLRRAQESLDAALKYLAATEHLPEAITLQSHVDDEALWIIRALVEEAAQRLRTLLEVVSGWLEKPQKRGPVPDVYLRLALKTIVRIFRDLGLPVTTKPEGLLARAASILLKPADKDVHPRDLTFAVKRTPKR
jgi:hypothetical protein